MLLQVVQEQFLNYYRENVAFFSFKVKTRNFVLKNYWKFSKIFWEFKKKHEFDIYIRTSRCWCPLDIHACRYCSIYTYGMQCVSVIMKEAMLIFWCIFARLVRVGTAWRHTKGRSVVSESTDARSANGSGCRGIVGLIWVRNVSNVRSQSILISR
jgi:hypothetical protein